jgi:hypothetical protein
MVAKNDMESIKNRIEFFKRLIDDNSNPIYRRSGLYGISSVGVALYQRNVRSQNL